MNQTIQSLINRKSVRVFSNQQISHQDKQTIYHAATQAPTAGNTQLYAMIEVSDQAIKDTLADTCDHQPFIAKAPLVVVFCADYQRLYEGMATFVDPSIRKPGIGDCFLAMADTFIAAQNAVVAAESLGIGSCYIGDIIENFETHQQLFDLPPYVIPVCMLVFGYPTVQQIERIKPTRFEVDALIYHNKYQPWSKADHQQQVAYRSKHGNYHHVTVESYYQDLAKRKYTADFSIEMNRSTKKMIEAFLENE